MEIFRLFGSILVDSDEANRSISQTGSNAESMGSKLSAGIATAAKWGAGIAAAAGTAALAIGTTAVNAAEDFQKSLNSLEASTGIESQMMGEMRDVMLDIYNNNFGESFEDIGKAMGVINQQTGASGDELTALTQSAIALRDTFDFEVNESMRAANMLMTQFGMDGEAAYNLIAQGAQWGLDKNGDLLDTINEYSVHFQQMGFDSEQMFNMLANGAAAGTFSVDKLGDAVKEFGIRSKDGSTASSEAFAALGLNATTMTNQFAAGGTTASAAFETVTTKLLAMKDPVAQNTAGVALFGTQWEDLGVKGVAALVSTEGEITKNKDALGQINAVKYDTFGEAMTGIKRQMETGILIPLGEKILPKLNEFATWIQENMPKIIEKFKEVAEKVVKFKDDTIALMDKLTPLFAGIAAGAVTFGIYTLAINASAIATGIWTTVTGIATAAGTAFGAVLAFITSPIGLVVVAITALVAAGVLLYQNWDVIKVKAIEIFNFIYEWIKNKITFIVNLFFETNKEMYRIGANMFNNLWDGIKGVWESISSWVSNKVQWLADKLSFWKSSQNTMGGETFNGISIQGRAVGGSVNAGQTYMVGEKGPELFTSRQSGTIIPNHKLSSAGTNINITITGNTLMGDADADRFGDLIIRRLKSLGVT